MYIPYTGILFGETVQRLCANSVADHQPDVVETSESSLRFLFCIFRHGIRSPVFPPYSTDPYKNYTKYFPDGDGSLTKSGKQLMYKVGSNIRERYGGFLSPQYSYNQVHFISTDMERTMMSAMLVSNGMFPPQSYQQWSDNINWQPIPIWLDNNEMDKTLIIKHSWLCPRYRADYAILEAKAKQVDSNADHKPLYLYISEQKGEETNCTFDLYALWDIFECESLSGYSLPNWVTNIYPEKMKSVVSDIFHSMINETNTMSRIMSGPVMFTLHNLLLNKVNGSLDPDWQMYFHSGHDVTVLAFLNAIGYHQPLVVRPGDGLLIELHCVSNEFYLKMFYYNATDDHSIWEVSSPICPPPCPPSLFIDSTVNLDPQQWQDECQL